MRLKSLLVVLLTGVALNGCRRMDPNSSEARYQTIFKEILRTSEDMGRMLHRRLPFGAEKFHAGSAKLHQLADQPQQCFPSPEAGEEGEGTHVKDEVWQHQQGFKAAAQVLIDAMNRLQGNICQATLTPDGVHKGFAAMEDACEAYYKKFRAL